MTRMLVSGASPWEPKLGYSRAVVQGDWCFVSGTTGLDPETGKFPDDVAEQARVALGIIAGALEKAGFGFEHVVRVNYIITDSGYLERIAPVLGGAFSEIRPAATMIVAGLVNAEMKIEIEVTAFKG